MVFRLSRVTSSATSKSSINCLHLPVILSALPVRPLYSHPCLLVTTERVAQFFDVLTKIEEKSETLVESGDILLGAELSLVRRSSFIRRYLIVKNHVTAYVRNGGVIVNGEVNFVAWPTNAQI